MVAVAVALQRQIIFLVRPVLLKKEMLQGMVKAA